MNINFKNIHIGESIKARLNEMDIGSERICNFLHCDEAEVKNMLKSSSLDCSTILRWSKLLEYDFFRLYSQHLILYSPPASITRAVNGVKSAVPTFRKNLYTQEIIYFILELIANGTKTKRQIIEEYKIPKTTLYKWLEKYSKK